MATMLDDFLHMNVEGADTMRGLRLLEVKEGALTAVFGPILSTMVMSTVPICIPNPAVEKIKYYAQNWATVSHDDRRDVIGALKAGKKIGMTAVKIVALISRFA